MRSLETMEALLAAGGADFFSMARPLVREPALVRRWRQGERERSPCISCSGCYGPARRGEGVRCMQRALAGETPR